MLSPAIDAAARQSGIIDRLVRFVRSRLPEGHALPADVWERQHRAILVLLWLHAIGIVCSGLITASGLVNSVLEGGLVAVAALLAGVIPGGRRLRSVLATLGLLTSSAVLVHLSGGFLEMHFQFLIMMVIVALYQDWVPFLLAIGYIVGEYTVVGILRPAEFYAGAAGGGEPWMWIAIHAAFVLAACIAGLVHWRLDESAHARAELILESAGEGIVGTDEKGITTFVNPAAARMLGFSSGDLLDRPVDAILRAEGRGVSRPSAHGSAVLATLCDGSVHHVADDAFYRKDGTAFPVEYVVTPIVEARDVVGAVLAFEDITDRKRAEEQRVRLMREQTARAEAEQAVRARDDLVSVISHDLRDPLGAVKGYAQLLRRRVSSRYGMGAEQTVEGLEKIDATATKMTALIDELLDVVRLEMGESLDLDLREVDLVALARRVVREQQQTTTHHRLAVVSGSGAVVGRWDERRLERALVNLVSNAIKYSPDGDVVVTVARVRDAAGDWAILKVRDEGLGIAAGDLPYIFERFHRVKREKGARVEGTGIGLASARAIVAQHGGTIEVESQEGVGSTFTVRLPLAR